MTGDYVSAKVTNMSNIDNRFNAREQVQAASEWLAYTDESLSFGLKSAEDALKLWKHMVNDNGVNLPEFADHWPRRVLVQVLGYDPLDGQVRSGGGETSSPDA